MKNMMRAASEENGMRQKMKEGTVRMGHLLGLSHSHLADHHWCNSLLMLVLLRLMVSTGSMDFEGEMLTVH